MIFIKIKEKILCLVLLSIPVFIYGQIIYTDVNPDSLITSQYELDLNNDGTAEFLIEAVIDGGINVVKASGISVNDSLAGFYGGYPNVVGYPYSMSSDQVIGSNTSMVDEGILGGDHPLIMEDAQWVVGPSRYLGLRFKTGQDIHYGWARLKMETDYAAFTVRDYAYNAAPGESINSGVTSVEDHLSAFSASLIAYPNPCNEKTIIEFLLADEAGFDLSVYDVRGKIIYSKTKEHTVPGKQFIELNLTTWRNGIYFCRIHAGNNTSTVKLIVAP